MPVTRCPPRKAFLAAGLFVRLPARHDTEVGSTEDTSWRGRARRTRRRVLFSGARWNRDGSSSSSSPGATPRFLTQDRSTPFERITARSAARPTATTPIPCSSKRRLRRGDQHAPRRLHLRPPTAVRRAVPRRTVPVLRWTQWRASCHPDALQELELRGSGSKAHVAWPSVSSAGPVVGLQPNLPSRAGRHSKRSPARRGAPFPATVHARPRHRDPAQRASPTSSVRCSPTASTRDVRRRRSTAVDHDLVGLTEIEPGRPGRATARLHRSRSDGARHSMSVALRYSQHGSGPCSVRVLHRRPECIR